MGELDSVQQLIGQETAHYQSLIGSSWEKTVKDPLIAGMLLGKTERARSDRGLEPRAPRRGSG